jgi:hypothetical protein
MVVHDIKDQIYSIYEKRFFLPTNYSTFIDENFLLALIHFRFKAIALRREAS